MLLEMFVNELSLTPAAADQQSGQERASQFVRTMTAATSRGVRRSLRLPEDFHSTQIAPDYNWYSWLSDKRVEREVQTYFRSLATKVPFLVDEADIEAEWAGMDCLWQGQQALGLKAAFVADGLALSLASREEWNTDSIVCEIQEILDNDVLCRSESIHHGSTTAHITLQTAWIQQRIQHTVKHGQELWCRMKDFFPSLICCAAVEDQMATFPAQSLASITRVLFQLNMFCVNWQNGAFDPKAIGCNVSPDSPSTLQKYGHERRFLCPDGQYRTFSWHAKVGREWRIYFDPAAGPAKLFLGYVGTHLNTVKFN
jgi:hypothetical protein